MNSAEFLTEATFNIGQDVDMLYDMLFKKVVQNIHNGSWDGRDADIDLSSDRINTSILNSKQAKQAHLKNPMKIITSAAASYNAPGRFISVSISGPALNLIRSNGNSISRALDSLQNNYPTQVRKFKADITPSRVKGTIYHELSHWLDDTFHNRHITKAVASAQERDSMAPLLQGENDVGMTAYEVNAQMHAIKQLKRDNNKTWDNITFDQMLDMSTALQVIEDALTSKDKQRWKKMILKRMAREKLLGAHMTKR